MQDIKILYNFLQCVGFSIRNAGALLQFLLPVSSSFAAPSFLSWPFWEFLTTHLTQALQCVSTCTEQPSRLSLGFLQAPLQKRPMDSSFLAVRGRRCLPENPWEHFLCSHSCDLWWVTQVRGLLVQGCGSGDLQGVPRPVAMLQFVGACHEALQQNNRCCQACWKKREKLLMCRVKSRGVWGMWKERRVREQRMEWKEHGGLKQRHRKRSQAWWKGRLGWTGGKWEQNEKRSTETEVSTHKSPERRQKEVGQCGKPACWETSG